MNLKYIDGFKNPFIICYFSYILLHFVLENCD